MGTFDVAPIRCPVTVLHGRSDRMVDVIHAHHTAELIPGANLVIFDDLDHFSIRAKLPASDTAVRAEVGSVSCAVHAKGKTALEVAEEIALGRLGRAARGPERRCPGCPDCARRP